MHINRVLNHQYFYELYNQNYLKAHKARQDNIKALNDAIKTSSTTPFYETLGYKDAFSYLEAQSNLNPNTLSIFSSGLSKFQENLIKLSDNLVSARAAVYAYHTAREEEDNTKPKIITIGEQEIELVLTKEDEDGTKVYSTDPQSFDVNYYKVENLSFETFIDENNNLSISSSAEIILGDNRIELALSENESGDYIFRFLNDEYTLVNETLSIYDIYLTEDGLDFYTDINPYNRTYTVHTNDSSIIDTLKTLEAQSDIWESGITDSLIENAKSNNNSILEEFISQVNNEEKNRLLQSLLQLQINAIYEENTEQKQSSQLLAYIINNIYI